MTAKWDTASERVGVPDWRYVRNRTKIMSRQISRAIIYSEIQLNFHLSSVHLKDIVDLVFYLEF